LESTYAPALVTPRWRTVAILVSLVATLELAVLVVVGLAVAGKSLAHHVRDAAIDSVAGTTATTAHSAKAGAPKLTRSDTDVLVLNGGGVSGAAASAADRLRGLGYLIGSVGNAPRPTATQRTLVMYTGSYRPEALRLAHDVKARLVTPLDGMKPSALLGAQLVLVVGR
jgi:LytR cell envelope-related transcriptional attenuator